MFEMMTCHRPFHGMYTQDAPWLVKQAIRPKIPDDSSYPVGFVELIQLCWLQDANSRPSIDEVKHSLLAIGLAYALRERRPWLETRWAMEPHLGELIKLYEFFCNFFEYDLSPLVLIVGSYLLPLSVPICIDLDASRSLPSFQTTSNSVHGLRLRKKIYGSWFTGFLNGRMVTVVKWSKKDVSYIPWMIAFYRLWQTLSLSNGGIAQIWNVDENNHELWKSEIIMECITRDMDMSKITKRSDWIIFIACQLLEIICFLHCESIVHGHIGHETVSIRWNSSVALIPQWDPDTKTMNPLDDVRDFVTFILDISQEQSASITGWNDVLADLRACLAMKDIPHLPRLRLVCKDLRLIAALMNTKKGRDGLNPFSADTEFRHYVTILNKSEHKVSLFHEIKAGFRKL